jgi:hypothetical protein
MSNLKGRIGSGHDVAKNSTENKKYIKYLLRYSRLYYCRTIKSRKQGLF